MPIGIDEAQLILRLIDAVSRVVAAVIGSGSGAYFAFWLMQRLQADSEKKRALESARLQTDNKLAEQQCSQDKAEVIELKEKVEKISKKHNKKLRKHHKKIKKLE